MSLAESAKPEVLIDVLQNMQEEERHFLQQQQLAGARLRGTPADRRQAAFEGRLRAGIATVLTVVTYTYLQLLNTAVADCFK